MDDTTKNLVDKFIQFLETELKDRKHFHGVQFEAWSLKDFKVSIKFFYHEITDFVAVDIRELKDNQSHFLHLLSNVTDQLAEKTGIQL